jgi:hypoxanthine phosphoribosyltransferase
MIFVKLLIQKTKKTRPRKGAFLFSHKTVIMNILFTSKQIQEKVTEMAHAIDFKHTVDDDVVMICVLNGAFMFFTDLVKQVNIDCEIDFIRAKSYSDQQQTEVVITKDIEIAEALIDD